MLVRIGGKEDKIDMAVDRLSKRGCLNDTLEILMLPLIITLLCLFAWLLNTDGKTRQGVSSAFESPLGQDGLGNDDQWLDDDEWLDTLSGYDRFD